MFQLIDTIQDLFAPRPDPYAMTLAASLLPGIPPEIILTAFENGVHEGLVSYEALVGARLVVYTYGAHQIGLTMRERVADEIELALE